jgi:hypothetical protein
MDVLFVLRVICKHDIDSKSEELRQKPFPVPICPPQIPHRLTWAMAQTLKVWYLTLIIVIVTNLASVTE